MRIAGDSLAKAGVIRLPRLFRLYASTQQQRPRDQGRHVPAAPGFAAGARCSTRCTAAKGSCTSSRFRKDGRSSQIAAGARRRSSAQPDRFGRRGDARHRAAAPLDVPTPTLEGYLFPDTYIFPDGTTARAAVDAMVQRFEQVWKPEWTARLDTHPPVAQRRDGAGGDRREGSAAAARSGR